MDTKFQQQFFLEYWVGLTINNHLLHLSNYVPMSFVVIKFYIIELLGHWSFTWHNIEYWKQKNISQPLVKICSQKLEYDL